MASPSSPTTPPSAAPGRYTLYGAPGSGATPVHAALTLIGLGEQVDTVDIATWEGDAERDRIAGLNPMRQVPALVLPSGELMTESAAILLWLGDRHPEAGLCPAPGDALRAQYLRWMVYLPAAIYSMFWVRDDPARLVPDKAAQPAMLERSAERVAHCWRLMDTQIAAPSPYLLGERIGMLDLYVAVMSRWTPCRERFYREAPRMAEVVKRVDAEPRLAAFWAERFPFTPGWERGE
ncbi:glutathione S-transferase family protein [Variovorax sp. Varisp41]|uniref:glutathione S-transferase family protein n=1 Tax=Variovorax sp. Varisp41 TaxID=3243033 RepID=UPI0039B5BEF0